MKALREAKACLAAVPAYTYGADRLKTALAALVEEIEAAPVGLAIDAGWTYVDIRIGDAFVSSATSELAGQRVRVLAAGDEVSE